MTTFSSLSSEVVTELQAAALLELSMAADSLTHVGRTGDDDETAAAVDRMRKAIVHYDAVKAKELGVDSLSDLATIALDYTLEELAPGFDEPINLEEVQDRLRLGDALVAICLDAGRA